jgi:arylsulfatase A-like enzyme
MYDADLRYLDAELERLLSAAESLGVLEDALVVITADHGEAFWERGEVEHGSSFHEAQVRIPLIVFAPGRSGGTVEHSVGLDDIAPAILSWVGGGDLAGLEPGSPDQQVPMGSLLFSEDGLACADGHHKAVRTDQLRLYDLAADPLEQRDLSRRDPSLSRQFTNCLRRRDAPQASAPFDIAGLQALGYVD